MPYKKKYQKRNTRTPRGFKRMPATNKLYRNPYARTLQISTKRNKSQVLKFTKNLCYKVVPGGSGNLEENVFLRFSANSIYNMITDNGSQNQPATWLPQDPSDYGPNVTITNADGWTEWNNRYFNFVVVGSRIQVTFEPTEAGGVVGSPGVNKVIAPSTFYVNLSAGNTSITPSTAISTIVQLPYTKRASVICGTTTTNQSAARSSYAGFNSVRLYQNYSTKRFQGIKDVADNKDLYGGMAGNASSPQEQSYFVVGMRPTIPSPPDSGGQLSPAGILRVKLEYIVKLTEPTSTNQIQEPAQLPYANFGGSFFG